MVREIRVYVEGGGDGKDTKSVVRNGFSSFLGEIIAEVRKKRIGWSIVSCGPRNAAFDNFRIALETHPEAFNILLVDSEGAVEDKPWKFLKNRDGWSLRAGQNEQCHLMVQLMESWLIADVDALKKFYGNDFNESSIPLNPDVEKIPKQDVEISLKKATIKTQKGEYHKIHHGPKILELLDVSKVRNAAPHCDRLFNTLSEYVLSASSGL